MKLKKLMAVLAVLAFASGSALAADKGLHLGGMEKDAKKAKIEAKKLEQQAEAARKKAEAEAKKAAKEAEKAAKKAEAEARKAAKKAEAEAKKAAAALKH